MTPPQPGRGTPPNQGNVWKYLTIGLLLVIVAGGAVFAGITAFGGDDSETAYRDKLDRSMRSLVDANKDLSDALRDLRPGRPGPARDALDSARTETSSTRGAINALTVPDGSEDLASNARQTLSRESSYLAGIDRVLDRPNQDNAEEAETLAGNLTDALDTIAPSDDDWSRSVQGADELRDWASRSASAARRKRAKADDDDEDSDDNDSSSSSAPADTSPLPGRDCGGGLRAGANTTCAFASNVRDAYNEAPGLTATVEVFSPATGMTYTMSCNPAGTGTTCSGGNNASVSF